MTELVMTFAIGTIIIVAVYKYLDNEKRQMKQAYKHYAKECGLSKEAIKDYLYFEFDRDYMYYDYWSNLYVHETDTELKALYKEEADFYIRQWGFEGII